MTTRWIRLGAVLMGACSAGACGTGGQTGQPTSASCQAPVVTVAEDERVDGVSPGDLARAQVGRYTAPLLWLAGADGSEQVGAPDQITIVIAYPGGDGTSGNCTEALSVGVTVEVTTRDSGLHQLGTASLVARLGTLEPATLYFAGSDLTASIQLGVDAGQVVVSGDLTPRGDGAPSRSAQFTSELSGVAGAGGKP